MATVRRFISREDRMMTVITAAQVARSVGVGPRSKRFVLRDGDGIAYDGSRTELVLAALAR